MNRLLLLLVLLLITPSVYSQTVTESILNIKEGYASGSLYMDYTRTFQVGKADTSYAVIMRLTSKETQIEGFSLGTALFTGTRGGWASGTSAGIDMRRHISEEYIVMDPDQFLHFVDGINKVFTFLLDKQKFNNNGLNTVATHSVEHLLVGGEFNPRAIEKLVFYFKMGDKAHYTATFDEYRKTIIQIAQVKSDLVARMKRVAVK